MAPPEEEDMYQPTADQTEPCAGCGMQIPERSRAFGFGEDRLLCWECSLRRGGTFDAETDRWTTEPGISDLAEADEP
jgi:hypothetical protein